MQQQELDRLPDRPPFHPMRLVAVVVLIMLAISSAAQWYARNITMPRYCRDPAETLARVEKLLTERRPAGDGERKPFIIAARLTFLIPQEPDEPLGGYLTRLQLHIDQQCR